MRRPRFRTPAHHAVFVVGAGCGVLLFCAGFLNDAWLIRSDGPIVTDLDLEAPVAGIVIGAVVLAMFVAWYAGIAERRWPLAVAAGSAAYVLVMCAGYWRMIATTANVGVPTTATWGLFGATVACVLTVVAAGMAALLTPPGNVDWTRPGSWAARAACPGE